MPKGMHNPLPASLGSECKKAALILDSFINGSWRGSPGRELPERVLRNAKGLAILTVTKAGLLGSLRFGSGIIIARLADNPDGSPGGWSPPSAISTAGLGFGGQAGFELTDFVFIFDSPSSLEAFSRLGSLTLSGNFSIAFGPLGRNAEIAGGVSTSGGGSMRSFAKTKGLFGGVSLESGVLVERRWANRRFFGRKVTAAEILTGQIEVPQDGREAMDGLLRVLEEVFATGTDAREEVATAPATAMATAEVTDAGAATSPTVVDNGHTGVGVGTDEHATGSERGEIAVPVPVPVSASAPGSGPQELGTATRPGPESEQQPGFNTEEADDQLPVREQTSTEAEAAEMNVNEKQAAPASASAPASR